MRTANWAALCVAMALIAGCQAASRTGSFAPSPSEAPATSQRPGNRAGVSHAAGVSGRRTNRRPNKGDARKRHAGVGIDQWRREPDQWRNRLSSRLRCRARHRTRGSDVNEPAPRLSLVYRSRSDPRRVRRNRRVLQPAGQPLTRTATMFCGHAADAPHCHRRRGWVVCGSLCACLPASSTGLSLGHTGRRLLKSGAPRPIGLRHRTQRCLLIGCGACDLLRRSRRASGTGLAAGLLGVSNPASGERGRAVGDVWRPRG